MIELDYLVVGHVTRDLVDSGSAVGGTASYAARTALALNCRVGVVTSASPELVLSPVLDGALIARVPALTTTTFENVYTPDGRRQVIHGVADRLTPDIVPPDWRVVPASGVVHVGPVARECDVALADAWGDAFVGVTPQGWMRRWDKRGHVSGSLWQEPEPWLARANAVVLSDEDVGGDETLLVRYASQTRLLVVTHGVVGCTVYVGGQDRSFVAPAVHQVDPTGAGDIFAAAFFVSLQRRGDPWMAARFANCVAANSVTRSGLASTPRPGEVACCEQLFIDEVG
jgi:sugar/nucleoside kinase (ribokinase family)